MVKTHERRKLVPAAFAGLVLLVLLLGGFSLFVGYNKALAPMDVLREHSAWTIHLPVWLGRAIGWAEMAAAGALILGLFIPALRRAGALSAIWITANHVVAAVVHIVFAEWHTLFQSAVVIALCLAMVALYRVHHLARQAHVTP